MEKYVFFFDLDGTLVNRTELPEENIKAIERARSEGCPVFLNTGRAPAFIPEWVFERLHFDGIIAGSGAYIRIGDETVQALTIPNETIAKNCTFLKRTGRTTIFEGIEDVLILNPNMETPYTVIEDGEDFLQNYADCKVQKLNLRGTLTFAERRYFSMFYTVIQHEKYAECSIPGTDKGTALEKVMERYPDCKSVAMGDSANDLDMLAVADISVAMGNSPDFVRHVCTHETDTVEQAGVAKAINGILDAVGDFADLN